jgi:hypothetical protein
MATKHFGTRAILKKKDGNGPVHDEEAGSWTESKQKSPSQQIEHHHHHELEGPLQNAFFYASSRSTFRLHFHFQSGLQFYREYFTLMMGPTLNAELLFSGPRYNGILLNDIFAGASNPFIRIFLSCPYLCSGYFVFSHIFISYIFFSSSPA